MIILQGARRKLKECEQHLNLIEKSRSADELEGHLSAFVSAARSVTFSLQKDSGDKDSFKEWYTHKQNEMREDSLCKFFKDLRDEDIHTGVSHIESFVHIAGPVDTKSWPNRPKNSRIKITPRGVYWILNSGTPEEKEILADVPKMINPSWFGVTPDFHLGQKINDKSIYGLCRIYLTYLEDIVRGAIKYTSC